ncbi:hypothetical protein Tco_1396564 [Tanacetum coccineum]
MAEHEAKRKKMFDEYNHQITHRADQLPITKISYIVNSSKEASIRITRAKYPLNVTVHERFRLRTQGFSEWLEVHALASKTKKDVVVDGMHRNLVPPPGIEAKKGLSSESLNQESYSIMRGSPEAEEMYAKLEMEIEDRDDAAQARIIIKDNLYGFGQYIPDECKASEGNKDLLSAKHQPMIKGLANGKASASNLRDIQVEDIIKEVEDYLKTYSSAEWISDGM